MFVRLVLVETVKFLLGALSHSPKSVVVPWVRFSQTQLYIPHFFCWYACNGQHICGSWYHTQERFCVNTNHRLVTASCLLDYDTIAGADQFGSITVVRVLIVLFHVWIHKIVTIMYSCRISWNSYNLVLAFFVKHTFFKNSEVNYILCNTIINY